MQVSKHGRRMVDGLIVVVPAVVTVYVVVRAVSWLDATFGKAAQSILHTRAPFPGLGVAFAIVAVYIVGWMAETWLLRLPVRFAEMVVERIPLIGSVYSALRDMLQFLSGADKESRGKPAVLRLGDGKVQVLGIVTQEKAEKFLPGDEERLAVYIPMSYQLGGYTVYVKPDAVEQLEGVSVEQVLKLALTAGVAKPAQPVPGQQEPVKEERP